MVPCAVHMEIGALRAKIIMRLRAKIYSLELRQKNTLNLYCHGNKNYHRRIHPLRFNAKCGVPECQRTRVGAKIKGNAGKYNTKMF